MSAYEIAGVENRSVYEGSGGDDTQHELRDHSGQDEINTFCEFATYSLRQVCLFQTQAHMH